MTDFTKVGSAIDITLATDIGVASSNDLAFTLARAVWFTSEYKERLLETILDPFLSSSTVHGWQKTFLEALLRDPPHASTGDETMSGSVDPLEKSLNFILQLLPCNVANRTFLGRNDPKCPSQTEVLYDQKAAKVTSRNRNCDAAGLEERFRNVARIALYVNDILASFNDDGVISVPNLLGNMKSFDSHPILSVDTLVLSSKGRNFCLLDPVQQKILLVLFGMQTVQKKIKVHLQEFIKSLDAEEQDIRHLGQMFADLIAVEILKCMAVFSSDASKTWVCNGTSFEHYFRDFQEILLQGIHSSVRTILSDRLTALAKQLDSAFGTGPLGFFIDLLVAFGLASYKVCGRSQPAGFIVHPACVDIFQVSWSAASYFQNGTNCYPLSNCVDGSTNRLVSIFKEREKHIEGVLLKKQGYAGPYNGEQLPYFLKIEREKSTSEVWMIVEQSFQVFAIFPACHLKNDTVRSRELLLEDIPSFDTRHSAPLLILGQFVDLCSIASNGGTLLKEEGKSSRQILVIGNIKKSSVMRGLRLGMTTDGMLDFLYRYSRTPRTSSKTYSSSAKEKYLSEKMSGSNEHAQVYHLPDIVIRQIRYWGMEARRLTIGAIEDSIRVDVANTCYQNMEIGYPYHSFWWGHLSSSSAGRKTCVPHFYEEIPIIIGGLSTTITQDESTSRLIKTEPEASDFRKTVKRRKEKVTEKYSLPCTYSNEYGDEILQKIKRRIDYQYFVRVCFDSEEERDAAFGNSCTSVPESLKSNIPHQENYRFVSQIGPLTYLAVINVVDSHP